jgi:collagen type III alpha
MSNNTRIEIKDGLVQGDEVLLNPRAVVAEAREESKDEEKVDVKKKFGGESPAEMPPANDPASGHSSREAGDAERERRGNDMMAADADGDGKISKEEAPEQIQQFFDRIDTNSDGYIDSREAAAARARRRQREADGGPGPAIPGSSGPGVGGAGGGAGGGGR